MASITTTGTYSFDATKYKRVLVVPIIGGSIMPTTQEIPTALLTAQGVGFQNIWANPGATGYNYTLIGNISTTGISATTVTQSQYGSCDFKVYGVA